MDDDGHSQCLGCKLVFSLLEKVVDIVNADWVDVDEETLSSRSHLLIDILEQLSVDKSKMKEKYEESCGADTRSFKSAILFACNLFISKVCDEMKNFDSDLELHMKQLNQLSTIISFVVSHGIICNLDFRILPAVPKVASVNPLEDMLLTSRNLLRVCYNEKLRDVLLLKNEVAVTAALLQILYSPLYKLAGEEKIVFEKSLKSLMTKWLKLENFVRCLLLLQGSSRCPSPSWLRKSCGVLLSRCLMLHNGVNAVISSLILFLGNDMSEWKKAEVISQILVVPPQRSSKKMYFESVAGQILRLLQHILKHKSNDSNTTFLQTLVASVLCMYRSSPDVMKCEFFDPIFLPLNALYLDCDNVYLKDSNFHLEVLHSIFARFKLEENCECAQQLLLPHLAAIFAIFCSLRQSINFLKLAAREILTSSLQLLEGDLSAKVLLHLCGIVEASPCQVAKMIKTLKPGITFNIDKNEELVTVSCLSSDLNDVLSSQDNKVQAVIEILTHCDIPHLATWMLIILIKQLAEDDASSETLDDVNYLLSPEEKETHRFCVNESRLLVFSIISAMCESVHPNELLSDVEMVSQFIQAILEKSTHFPEDSTIKILDSSSLKSCFAILGIFLFNKPTKKQLQILKKIVPVLQKLSTLPHLEKVDQESASDLALAIATSGLCSQDLQSFSNIMQEEQKKCDNSQPPPNCHESFRMCSAPETEGTTPTKLIEEVPIAKRDNLKCNEDSGKMEDNDLSDVMKLLADPSPPIRTASLRFIASGLSERKIKSTNELFTILLDLVVKEEDSFVYLSCIQALTECIDKFPVHHHFSSNSFQQLVKKYDELLSFHGDVNLEAAMKLSEVIVRVVCKLGDMIQFGTRLVIPVLFRASRHAQPSIRASALSCLASIISMLNHSLNSFQHELSDCVCTISKSDDDGMVRSAAIQVMRSLIEDLKWETLQMFPSLMSSFYSTLKHVYTHDKDHTVTLQAQLAIEVLERTMRDVLFTEANRQHRNPQKQIVFLP